LTLYGKEVLFYIQEDPYQLNDLSEQDEYTDILVKMKENLKMLLQKRRDEFMPGSAYKGWLDSQRRVVRNAFGQMSHPESKPDWSLLEGNLPSR